MTLKGTDSGIAAAEVAMKRLDAQVVLPFNMQKERCLIE